MPLKPRNLVNSELTDQIRDWIDLSWELAQIKWWILDTLDATNCPTEKHLDLGQKRCFEKLQNFFLTNWDKLKTCMDQDLLTNLCTCYATVATASEESRVTIYHAFVESLPDLGEAQGKLTIGEVEFTLRTLVLRLNQIDGQLEKEQITHAELLPQLQEIDEQIAAICPVIDLFESIDYVRQKRQGIELQKEWLEHTEEKLCLTTMTN